MSDAQGYQLLEWNIAEIRRQVCAPTATIRSVVGKEDHIIEVETISTRRDDLRSYSPASLHVSL